MKGFLIHTASARQVVHWSVSSCYTSGNLPQQIATGFSRASSYSAHPSPVKSDQQKQQVIRANLSEHITGCQMPNGLTFP